MESTDSDSMEAAPVKAKATSLATAMPKLAMKAATIARALSSLPCPSAMRRTYAPAATASHSQAELARRFSGAPADRRSRIGLRSILLAASRQWPPAAAGAAAEHRAVAGGGELACKRC